MPHRKVATTTVTGTPRAAASAISPPAPSDSSSGCAATTINRRRPARSSGRSRSSSPDVGPRRLCGAWIPMIEASGRRGRAHLDPLREVEHGASQRRLVPLGMVLPQVQLQVGDPPGMSLVPGQRRRPQRVADPLDARPRRRGRRPRAPGRPATRPPGRRHGRRRPATAASASTQRAPVRTASTAPRCMAAIWSGSLMLNASRMVLARPTAPPYQHAATPMPPQAKPGRRRYQPSGPPESAGQSVRSIGPDGTSASPLATHPSSVACTPAPRRSMANNRRVPLPVWAVISAWLSRAASEHQGLVPFSCQFHRPGSRRPGRPRPRPRRRPTC